MLNEWHSNATLLCWFDFCGARDKPGVSHFKIQVTEKTVSSEMNRYGAGKSKDRIWIKIL